MEDKKALIYHCGKELFSKKGYKAANVSDITKMAGIGVGTFYNYYSSKDELFLEIFKDEDEKLKKSLLSIDIDRDPVKVMREIMAVNLTGLNSNPILKEWYDREVVSKLEKEYFKQGAVKSMSEMMEGGILALIQKWKSEGKIRNDIEDEMILAIFMALPYIDIHKEDIGAQFFPQIILYISEFIMKGLTDF